MDPYDVRIFFHAFMQNVLGMKILQGGPRIQLQMEGHGAPINGRK